MEEPNPPENRNINTRGGNYNERIEGDYVQGNVFKWIISLFKWTINIFVEPPTALECNPARPKNQRILLAAVKEEITSRLRQSLHNAVLINLGKEVQPQQVKRPWDAEIKVGQRPPEPLLNTTTILEVFDLEEIAGKLLILGTPGAGKTTTQLELAQALVKRAEEQTDAPVPVLFNLSSWKDPRQSIPTWLVEELNLKYGVRKDIGKKLIGEKQLLPMLDGLDEAKLEHQESCVESINKWLQGEDRPISVVVCSRREEYISYTTRLQLNGAIVLQDLTDEQIQEYLFNVKRVELWSLLQQDTVMLNLVKTPLLLSITVLSYEELSLQKWQQLTSTKQRIKMLLDAYVQRMLNRVIESRAYRKNTPPKAKQIQHWLVFLARQLQQESKTEFLIERMQPSCLALAKNQQKQTYWLINELIFGLFLVLLYSSDIWQFLLAIFVILLFAIWNSNFNIQYWKPIQLFETVTWSFKKAKKSFTYYAFIGLILGLIVWLILMLIISMFGNELGHVLLIGVLFLLLPGLAFGLMGGVIGGIIVSEIDLKKRPNQGIWKSIINVFIISFIIGLIFDLTLGLNSWLIGGMINGWQFSEPVSELKKWLVSIWRLWLFVIPFAGAFNVFPHIALRLTLYKSGYIPWNYARFLNYCTELCFLQRVGGRYRFIHKQLQDYFAQM